MEPIVKTGKTIEAAISAALEELDLTREKVNIEVLEQPTNGLFGIGAKPAKVKVTPFFGAVPIHAVKEEKKKNDVVKIAKPKVINNTNVIGKVEHKKDEKVKVPVTYVDDTKLIENDKAAAFIKKTINLMGIEVHITKIESKDSITYDLAGPNMGSVIGRRGETLDSLQYLVNVITNHDHSDSHKRIILDAEEYRKRREETLIKLATRLAGKAKRSGRRVSLEPMSPMERRIIHTALQNDSAVTTISEGEDPFRHLVIIPKDSKKRRFNKKDSNTVTKAEVDNTEIIDDTDSDDVESLEFLKNYTHVNGNKRKM